MPWNRRYFLLVIAQVISFRAAEGRYCCRLTAGDNISELRASTYSHTELKFVCSYLTTDCVYNEKDGSLLEPGSTKICPNSVMLDNDVCPYEVYPTRCCPEYDPGSNFKLESYSENRENILCKYTNKTNECKFNIVTGFNEGGGGCQHSADYCPDDSKGICGKKKCCPKEEKLPRCPSKYMPLQ